MSCLVIDFELSDINIIRAMGVLIDGNVQWIFILTSEKTQAHKTSILIYRKIACNVVEFARICLSYPFRLKTTYHCAELKSKLFGKWILHQIKLLEYTPVKFNYMETLAKIFVIPARQNQFIQENNFNKAPVRQIAIARNTISAFTGS